jgi:peptidoglycan/xylan/chitin deacetylase (PgdA/CDA1 family)
MRSISRSTIAVLAVLAAVGSLTVVGVASAARAPKTLVCKDVTAKGGSYKATSIRVTGLRCAEARNDLASWLRQGSKYLPRYRSAWHSRTIAGGKWLAEYGNRKVRPTITFVIRAVPKPTPPKPPASSPVPAPTPAPDMQAPAITLDSPSDGARYGLGQTVIAHFSCADNVAVAKCSGTVPDGAAVPTDTLGSHTFAVTAVDTAGNTVAKTVTYSVGDTTSPTVHIASPLDGQSFEAGTPVTAQFTCKDNDAVAGCASTFPNGATVPTNVPGTHPFAVTATDASGNVTTVIVHYTVVDTTKPTITITSPVTGSTYDWGQSAQYSCSDMTTVASCTATVGTTTVATGTPLPPSEAAGAGPSTLTVTATDSSGNRSTLTISPYTVKAAGYYALTFHDGPAGSPYANGAYTQGVLDNLKSVNAHATFFLIGANAKADPALAKKIVDAGMQVGNHTMNHYDIASSFNNPFYQKLYPLPFGDTATKEIADGKAAIIAATNATPRWFEPPFGDYGIDSTVQNLVTAAGETLCAWTVDSTNSADPTPPSATIVARVVNGYTDADGTHPGVAAGGIVEMHDTSQQTVDSVVPIVTQLANTKGLLPGAIVASPQGTSTPGPFGSPQPSFFCTAGPWIGS